LRVKTDEPEIIERIAALDVGKAEVVCCARVPGPLAERQMLRPSFVPPPAIRQLRDLTRYRVDLLAVRTAEKQRGGQAARGRADQLSVVVSDPFGVSGREIGAALIAGERDPAVLAELAAAGCGPRPTD
jgi:hypothetical protein